MERPKEAMMRQALAVIVGLLCLSCSTRPSPRGPVFVLRPIPTTPTDHLPDRDAVKHDADVIAKRFALFGYRQLRVLPVEDGISIQFPRSVDDSQVADVIGRSGALAFCLVEDERSTYDALKTIDDAFRGTARGKEATLLSYVLTIGGDFGVEERDYPVLYRMLEASRPNWPVGFEFLFGPTERQEGSEVRRLYMLKTEPEMYGPVIEDALPEPYRGSEPGLRNTWIVSLKLAHNDAAVFAQVTERNIGRRLAIVLDSVVRSAPVVQSRIPDGNAMITTSDANPDDARNLSVMLRAGMLRLRWRVETTRR
jgi:preprotein translocase subunit SecD